jgi:[ribosomal protein S5]-alanine N-acetyltransferase
MTIVLTTERLRLRHVMADDAPFIVELLNDPAFLRNIGDRGVRNVKDAESYIAAGPGDSYQRHGFGLFLAELKGEDLPIGLCGLVQRDYLDAPDLGFALMPAFRARGFTYEAARGVVDYARQSLRAQQLYGITSLDNQPSIQLLGKLGFALVRVQERPPDNAPIKVFLKTL